ncbi:MAG: ABC-F family ATP-binding cassette domain-containing protein [Prevotella sp.]|jgi:ATPase subunit of ABC transporter with duplicated ATPase domains
MSISVSGVSHHFANQQPLFAPVSFSVATHAKAAIVGDNGTGKSTLLRIIAGRLQPTEGAVQVSSQPFFVPQLNAVSYSTVAEALGIADKLQAMQSILAGSSDAMLFDILGDDWGIEQEALSALESWGMGRLQLTDDFNSLSGGEKTRVMLAGVSLHPHDILLLDEPTNHLDLSARHRLYDLIRQSQDTILLVSHDVTLLNLMDMTFELSPKGIRTYGGNYDFYHSQREVEQHALQQQIKSERSQLKTLQRNAQKMAERMQKREARGAHDKQKGGAARILLNAKAAQAQNSSARVLGRQGEILEKQRESLSTLKDQQNRKASLAIDLADNQLHAGKMLIRAENVNFAYPDGHPLWSEPINLEFRSGERIQLLGDNGCGKSTLLQLLVGKLKPTQGKVVTADFFYHYLDQEYEAMHSPLTVLQMADRYNVRHLPEHEVRLRLNRALFPESMWERPCQRLSGGEQMRLYLCCLLIANPSPDLFVLDEPTNNLDLSSLDILTSTMEQFHGALLVVSHDEAFVGHLSVSRQVTLPAAKSI